MIIDKLDGEFSIIDIIEDYVGGWLKSSNGNTPSAIY